MRRASGSAEHLDVSQTPAAERPRPKNQNHGFSSVGLAFASVFLDFSGKEMEEEYVPWVEKSLNRYGTQGTKRRMKKQFPDIKPLDIEKAIQYVLTRRADRS